ncbi:sensor histidine kinase [Rossellomorea vietnamensis]|uniref:Sensor histidine kinase n=1 Tax=Rossellomorea vietnamensis TaxID=218284 RepID=A0ACD4CDN6_9BACI|nr:sensor histidine kinase [Rossellomorea vietnamensis]UXH46391.1 sensor histidine kinase [Rossellomorea vietnamensis]
MPTIATFPWWRLLIIPSFYMLLLPFGDKWYGYLLFLLLALAFWKSTSHVKYREPGLVLQHMCVMGLIVLFNPWNIWFGLYPAIVTGFLPSFRRITVYTGSMVAFYIASVWVHVEFNLGTQDLSWIPILILLIGLPYFLRNQQISNQIKTELLGANEEIARLIKIEERERIARDLHDTLGHTLSLLTLKGELVEQLVRRNPDEAIQEVRELQDISRNTLMKVRKLVSDMQSVQLSEEVMQVSRFLQSAGIEVHVQTMDFERIPLVNGKILGLCLRECVTNIVKHSRAENCWLRMVETGGSFLLEIEDDGVGMEGVNRTHDGSGLMGMKERLRMIEGTLDWTSNAGGGMKITISVPKIEKPMSEAR